MHQQNTTTIAAPTAEACACAHGESHREHECCHSSGHDSGECRGQHKDPVDISQVDKIVKAIGTGPEALIPILQAVQEHFRYLPKPALERICQISQITPAAVAGVSTFYTQFRHQPVGEHIIRVCHGTACHVKGSELVQDAIRRYLRLDEGKDTDAKGKFTLERVGCLGCCTLAPVLQIGGVTYGHTAPDTVGASIEDFLEYGSKAQADGEVIREAPTNKTYAEIRVGVGSCCAAGGSLAVRSALQRTLRRSGGGAIVKSVGCVGMCHQTPLVEVMVNGGAAGLYAKVSAREAEAIVHKHFRPQGFFRRLRESFSTTLDWMLSDENRPDLDRHTLNVRESPVCDFLGPQKRIATEACGDLDPLDLDEYLRADGFISLRRWMEKPGELIVDEIKKSGLRGRGGAGFPTGVKWAAVAGSTDPKKYIICNGDEGDPGAFMDRMILESYPYRVLEGMTIASMAIGASEGVLYIREEYPLAVKRIRQAIKICEERNLLGDNILGSGKSLHLRIMLGAGAFVCGEETALIASIEGRRGMPRLRPPFPAEKGLLGHPTLINNVETYALVPWIMRRGGDAFAALGTGKSKGTKVFALAGKVARGGLIEVPMGTTIRQIVTEIGGGVPGGRKFKAVQIGGPSGGCIPESMADVSVDYESLAAVGAIMGSGGLIVMDDADCMVDIARYFLHFTQAESCGKCTFCRVGTKRMLDILDRLCSGKGRKGDIETLEELAAMTKSASLCGLGQTAPNPVITTLKHFRHEYEAHLAGKCPAGKCKDLIKYQVTDECIGCTKCAQHCPVNAIPSRAYAKHEIDQTKCTRCDVCRLACPVNAITVS